MDVEDRERIERALIRRLDNVNEWLKFAEAKNAGLLAFSGAVLVAIVGYVGAKGDIPSRVALMLFIAAGTFIGTTLFALASFLPRLTPLLRTMVKQGDPNDNLEFFGDLLKRDAKTLTEEIAKLYSTTNCTAAGKDKLLTDIANQIIINSGIAFQKFKFFSWGLYTIWLGIFVTGVSVGLRELLG